ncbi:MAG: 50S ribosomal protein L25/general stress protein Ctc [Proteobacteria bacterium]|nr:50S ribosomal protein L25/general stress protein Ctc [Pseudomonadota bacterium]
MAESTALKFNVELRDIQGTKEARALRRKGYIPAIVYGDKKESFSVSVFNVEFYKYYNASIYSKLIEFDVPKKGKINAIVRQIQTHPVTDKVIHIDFQDITGVEFIKMTIPMHVINEEKCLGIKRGGVLNVIQREIQLLVNPHFIPRSIDIDIANMQLGHNIHANDLNLPKGVQLIDQNNPTILSISGRDEDNESTSEDSEKKA